MLVLERDIRESIIINDDIKITVLGINKNKVRIGVDAPQDVSIHRQEIYNIIQREKKGDKDANLH